MAFTQDLFSFTDINDSIFYNEDSYISDENINSKTYNYSRYILRKAGGVSMSKLNPWYITGFTDAEGSFSINATTTSLDKFKVGLQYKVTQLQSSEEVLHNMVDYFGVGKVHIDNSSTNTLKYQVQDLVSIKEKILPHFSEYPLQTSKALDYRPFRRVRVFDILSNKQHFTSEGKQQLFDIKNQMNHYRSKAERWKYLHDHKSSQSTS